MTAHCKMQVLLTEIFHQHIPIFFSRSTTKHDEFDYAIHPKYGPVTGPKIYEEK